MLQTEFASEKSTQKTLGGRDARVHSKFALKIPALRNALQTSLGPPTCALGKWDAWDTSEARQHYPQPLSVPLVL